MNEKLEDFRFWLKDNSAKIASCAIIVVVILLIFQACSPKIKTLEIEDVFWVGTVEIEEERTVEESGWSVPSGGRVYRTAQEVESYRSVLDHYDEVQRSRQVPDGTHEEVVGYRDLGDGYFEEVTRTVTDYRTEYYTEREPVYRNEPVYATKYYYEIERWFYSRSVVTSEHDKTPYYGEVILADKERESSRKTEYKVSAQIQGEDDIREFTLNHADWSDLLPGDTIKARVHFDGRIEILHDNE